MFEQLVIRYYILVELSLEVQGGQDYSPRYIELTFTRFFKKQLLRKTCYVSKQFVWVSVQTLLYEYPMIAFTNCTSEKVLCRLVAVHDYYELITLNFDMGSNGLCLYMSYVSIVRVS